MPVDNEMLESTYVTKIGIYYSLIVNTNTNVVTESLSAREILTRFSISMKNARIILSRHDFICLESRES